MEKVSMMYIIVKRQPNALRLVSYNTIIIVTVITLTNKNIKLS